MKGSVRCLACRKPNAQCACRGETRREMRVTLGQDPVTGKPRQQSRTITARKKEADTQLAKFVSELTDNNLDPTTITLGEAMDYWLEHVAAKDRGAGTLKNYRQITAAVKQAPIGTAPLAKLDTFQIQAFYDRLRAMGRAANTVGRYHAAIRAALNLANSRRWIAHNPALGTARPPIRNPELTIPSPAQVTAIIRAAEARSAPYAMFLRLAAASWARRGELVGLRRSAVLLGPKPQILIATSYSVHQGLKDTKSHGKRQITIDAGTAIRLHDHFEAMDKRAANAGLPPDPDPFVFSDEADCSRPWDLKTPWRAFTKAAETAGVSGVRLHDLRHFGATQAIAAGVPITTVSFRLGHSKVTTTLNIYAHYIPASDDLNSALMGELLAAAPAVADAAPELGSGPDRDGDGSEDPERDDGQ